jgi:hypothetical protein
MTAEATDMPKIQNVLKIFTANRILSIQVVKLTGFAVGWL